MKAWQGKAGFKEMNRLGKGNQAFLAIIPFDKSEVHLSKLENISKKDCEYAFPALTNSEFTGKPKIPEQLNFTPPDKQAFHKAFQLVKKHINQGDSYLCNLSFEVPLNNPLSLATIFHQSHAKYKLRYKDEFVCFSPEIFVRINDNIASTYPMKGTIDATVKEAKMTLLKDEKEIAEHYTITDLLRNDLSRIAEQVRVEDFRYIDEIKSSQQNILQTSTKISGTCKANWQSEIGDMLDKMLPAGSISGAPKQKTIEIINQAETHHRGFYTGVACLFDGYNLDSFVMIRMIVKRKGKFYYKTGGGITSMSEEHKEYQELIQKIYVPVS